MSSCCCVLVLKIGSQQAHALGVAVRPAFFLCLPGHFTIAFVNFIFAAIPVVGRGATGLSKQSL